MYINFVHRVREVYRVPAYTGRLFWFVLFNVGLSYHTKLKKKYTFKKKILCVLPSFLL